MVREEKEEEDGECNRDGIGKGEKKEREDSIRKIDTDLYNKTNLQKLQCSMCCSINCSTTERGRDTLFIKERLQ